MIGKILENSCYERIYSRFLLLHLRELRWPMLDSDCANAGALNGLPGPTRRWFTDFTHSHSLVADNHTNSHAVRLYFWSRRPKVVAGVLRKEICWTVPTQVLSSPNVWQINLQRTKRNSTIESWTSVTTKKIHRHGH